MTDFVIETSLPECISLRNRNRYLLEGWVAGRSRTRSVAVRIGEKIFPAREIGLYRPDVKSAFFPAEKSFQYLFPGFSIPVVLDPVETLQVHEVALTCTFVDGTTCSKRLGTVTLAPWAAASPSITLPPQLETEDLLVICMATYNPEGAYFRRQLESIRNQDFRNWFCLICDDNSSAAAKAAIRSAIAGDARFQLVENDRNTGFYGNFERCLGLVPAPARFVALADQDDIWYPHKLSTCLQAFAAGTMLVYSDMKIVDRDRKVLSPTYWKNRKNYYAAKDLDLLTLANTVTGAASVFRRELLDLALPFPPRSGAVFHDQWLAILAAGNGGIRYVETPLYEYVQYDSNVIGHVDFGRRSLFSAAKAFISDAAAIRKEKKRLRDKIVMYLKAGPCLAISLYQFRHLHARHIDALAETALLRPLDAAARRLVRRTRTITGLFRIHLKVWRNGETLNNLELVLCFSELVNRLSRLAAPLLALLMECRWRRRLAKETGQTVNTND